MTSRFPVVCAVAVILPVLAVACLWVFGHFEPVSVLGVTAYPVLRAGAMALYGSAFLALLSIGWFGQGKDTLPKGLATLFLAVLTVAMALERLYTFEEAFERDLMVYMVVADRWLDGQSLYADIWDHKPPAIHWTYALFASIFGPTPLAIWVMGVSMSVVTMVGCFVAARRMAGMMAALGAAYVWAFVSADLTLQANQPNVEVFMNATLVWAFALLVPVRNEPPGGLVYGAAGILLALSSLYKYVAVVPAILMALTCAVDRWYLYRRFPAALKPLIVIGGIGVAVWAAVFGLFWLGGTHGAFLDAVFGYNRAYAGNYFETILRSLNPYEQPSQVLVSYVPLFVLIVSFSSLCFLRREAAVDRLFASYFFGAVLMVVLPGQFFPHYYQLLLPLLAIGAGLIFSRTASGREPIYIALLVTSFLFVVAARGAQVNVSLMEIASFKYGRHGVESEETRQMADWINRTQPAEAHIYHWGAEPGVWFWSGRKPMTGFVFNFPLYGDSDRTRRYIERQIADLEQAPPDLIIAKRHEIALQDHPIEKWIARRYRVIQGPEGITQYVFLSPRLAPG